MSKSSQARRTNAERQSRRYWNNRRLYEEFLSTGCADCGITDRRVLNADHRDPLQKKGNASTAMRWNTGKVKRELAKCDAVCMNCHAIRTWTRAGRSL